LQVLQKTIRKVILRPLTASILLARRAAVGANEFNPVLLRIAVQSCPASAAHPNRFYIAPFHGFRLLQIHVHMTCDAVRGGFDTKIANRLSTAS
jgi:hypothetical protein